MILQDGSKKSNLMTDKNADHHPFIYSGTFITELFACEISRT